MSTTGEQWPAKHDVECRKPGCDARSPEPVSTARDGIAWMEAHGREAHDNPYLGARWTRVPEPEADIETRGEQDADRVTASRDDLAREYNHGAETAYQLTAHSAAGGRSADYIEDRHLELTGPQADQGQRTPAEHKWARGYAAGAESSVSLLRDREAADAAERDAMEPGRQHGAQYELEAAG